MGEIRSSQDSRMLTSHCDVISLIHQFEDYKRLWPWTIHPDSLLLKYVASFRQY